MEQIIFLTLFILAVAFCLPFLSRSFGRHTKLLYAVKYFIFAVYLFANLSVTIIFRSVQSEWMPYLTLFSSYRESLEVSGGLMDFIRVAIGQGLQDALQTITVADTVILKNIILNILLYMPLGYLLPFVFPRLMRIRRALKVLSITLIGFFFSLATETVQLYFHLGSFEVDDLFNNTLGCLIGCILYLWIMKRTENSCIRSFAKRRQAVVRAAADAQGESVKQYVNKALLARMGLKEWPEKPGK